MNTHYWVKDASDVWHIFPDRTCVTSLCGCTIAQRNIVGHPVTVAIQIRIDNCGECIMEHNKRKANRIPDEPLFKKSKEDCEKLQEGFKVLFAFTDENDILQFAQAEVKQRYAQFNGGNPVLTIQLEHNKHTYIENNVSIYDERIITILSFK